jgi:hypothetical protein
MLNGVLSMKQEILEELTGREMLIVDEMTQ